MKKTLRFFSVFCFAMLSMTLLHAQEVTYSGRVTSAEDGEVIIGANITVSGTTRGTSTGVDGKYVIKASAGNKLVFSYLGMQSQTITLGKSTVINVVLQSDSEVIEDVIVVAFGTSRRKDLTGSIAAVDTKLITQESNSSLSRTLEGAIPGVQIASNAGQPGTDAKIQVRGLGTVQGNSSALIVIDGVPANNPNVLSTLNPQDVESIVVSKDAASNSLYGSRGANGVVLITTKKGAKGRSTVSVEGRFGINQQGARDYDIIRDPKEIYEYAWKSIYNSARYKGVEDVAHPNMDHAAAAQFASEHLFDYDGSTTGNAYNGLGNYMLYKIPDGSYLIDPATGKLNKDAKLLYYDDWRKEFNKSRFRQEYNVSVSGSNEKSDHYISMGYLADPSFITGSDFNRYNGRVNVNTQVYSWLKAGANMSFTRRYMRQPAVRWGGFNPGTVRHNIFYWLDGINQLKPLWARDLDGKIKRDANGKKLMDLGSNQTDSPYGPTHRMYPGNTPLVLAEEDKWETVTKDFMGRSYFEATFLKDFRFTTNFSVDNTSIAENRYNNQRQGDESPNGRLRKQNTDLLAINTQQLLNWNRSFDKHKVEALLGHEYMWEESENLNIDKYMMLINGMDDFGNAIGINGAGGSKQRGALEGYFFRSTYNYDDRYYLQGSVRLDGSSKFKDRSHRWGTFWSLGTSWRISREHFMRNATWLDDLKIRASYGVMGDQNGVGRYEGYSIWNLGNSGDIKTPSISISKGKLGNPDLSWETSKTIDVGVDFRLWDRFYGSLDFYNRETQDMIWNRPMPTSIGMSTFTENTATMRNYGVELDLGVEIIKTNNVFWNLNINGTHYKNKLTSLPPGVGSELLGGNYEYKFYLRGKNMDYYTMYFAKYAGVDQKTGLGMVYHTVDKADHDAGRWVDAKLGEKVKTTEGEYATRYKSGSAIPDFIGGFNTNFRYKNFDFSLVTSFQIGGVYFMEGFVYGDGIGMSDQEIGNGIGKVWKNAWTPDNPKSHLPMRMLGATNYGIMTSRDRYTDLALCDASFLSIKNITLGYSLPERLMDKWGIRHIRVYTSLDNMWLFTYKPGIDPRQSLDGGASCRAYSYPQMRSMSLGISASF